MKLLRILKHLAVYIAPPLLFVLVLIYVEAQLVMRTGMCPGNHTGPGGPCSVSDFLLSGWYGGFAVVGIIAIFCFWACIITPVYVGFFRRLTWENSKLVHICFFGTVFFALGLFSFWVSQNI